jgi:hypothetical protein
MDAADCLYGVSMAGDGVSKVISRRMPREEPGADPDDADMPERPGRRFAREDTEERTAA